MTIASDPTAFDPHDPAFLADPYPTYARFRDSDPISLVQPYGASWVFRAADIRTALDDPVTYLKHAPGPPPPSPGVFGMNANLPNGLFSSDPPRHAELRAVLEPLFVKAIQPAPQIAESVAAKLLTGLSGTRMELVQDFALPLPSAVLFTIMGIPDDHWPVLIQWVQTIATAHDITQPMSTRMLGATCSMALNAYLADWVIQCRNDPPTSGLIGEMCAAIGSGGLTAEDVEVCGNDFLVAGYLSTTFLIGTGLVHLLQNPDQVALLRSQPDLIHGAVEEMLRIDAPAQIVDRVVAVDTELGGTPLTAGSRISLVLGSAGRDPDAFANPDTFDLRRESSTQLSFGDGIHHCIGAPLVRLVAPVAIAALLELTDLTLAGTPQWQTDPYLRAMTNLPLSFAAS